LIRENLKAAQKPKAPPSIVFNGASIAIKATQASMEQ
jgi:hypothetical protein